MNKSDYTKETIIAEINRIRSTLQPENIKKYKVNSLNEIVHKLDKHADECEECSKLINSFRADVLNHLKSIDNKQSKYESNVKKILSHLRVKHYVVTGGFFISIYVPVGIGVGFLIGSFLNNLVVGFAIGIAGGLIAGAIIEFVARKNGFLIKTD